MLEKLLTEYSSPTRTLISIYTLMIHKWEPDMLQQTNNYARLNIMLVMKIIMVNKTKALHFHVPYGLVG